MDNSNSIKNELLDVAFMMEKMPEGFFVYRANENEDILYTNDVLLEIFGCKDLEEFKELTGYTFKGLVHPDDLVAVEKSIGDDSASDDKFVEFRITRKDGSIRWVDDHERLIHTQKDGNLYYVFIRDVTDQHLSREESHRREKIIDGLSIGFSSIYLLDLKTAKMKLYQMQNAFIKEIFHKLNLNSNDEVDSQKILPVYADRFVFKDDKDLFLKETSIENIAERIKTEQSYTFHYRFTDSSDAILHMEVTIIKINDDELSNLVMMCYRDVTEQINKVQKDLEEKLNIEMALDREHHANEIKASFLFNISHDIRTPMNAIMGFTSLAKRHINEPNLLLDYLNKLDESNHHMLALIDDLLEMSQIDCGNIDLKNMPCKLKDQLDIVVDMFRVQAGDKNIVIIENFDLPDVDVFIDALRFRRIMSNIFGNAVKFTPNNGQITISARQKRVSKSGYARFEFIIADTGIGMTEEFMQRMFEAFEREESSTKTGYIGTGLGLSISKRLLDIMGGSIDVSSKKGEGSSFCINLPLKLATQSQIITSTPQRDFKASGKHRILLVEDIEVNRLLAETILKESGFLVESVPDGCDAVESIKNSPVFYYDLVLMDIQMPIMNGYEATRAIRSLGREDTDSIPIIALSANAREQDKKMSMESGMNSHVAKPFDIALLISTVNEHIDRVKKGG